MRLPKPRPGSRAWDTGCYFSLMVRMKGMPSIYDDAIRLGWWTETPITGFPGFKVHPLYDDFSTPTFDMRHNLDGIYRLIPYVLRSTGGLLGQIGGSNPVSIDYPLPATGLYSGIAQDLTVVPVRQREAQWQLKVSGPFAFELLSMVSELGVAGSE